jgi:hypothetical protein
MWAYIYILFAHYISDFILQTRHIANRKSTSLYYLSLHVGIYSVATIIFWMVFSLFVPNLTLMTLFFVFIVTFVSHWVTDFITSKFTTKYYKLEKYKEFFSMIGFDQWVHALTLFLTYDYLILH